MKVTATQIKNNFGKYLKMTANEDIIITKNGHEIACLSKYNPDTEERFYVREGSLAYSSLEPFKANYEEYLKLIQDSLNRYEYINGLIYLLASPTHNHQLVSSRLNGEFYEWFKNQKCKPFYAPYDVKVIVDDEINVAQPDILVICDDENVDDKGKYQGVPALVVEILSPDTKSKDMVLKLELYMRGGIGEYWIVDIEKKEIYVYTFKDKSLETMSSYKIDDIVESKLFSGLNVDMKSIF